MIPRACVVFPVVVLLGGLSACPGRTPLPPPPAVEAPDLFCPGGPTCSALGLDDPLLAGVAKRVITPEGFEVANARYLDTSDSGDCPPEAPVQNADLGEPRRCGNLLDNIFDDCGTDALCFNDDGYPGPDVDGSERDGNRTDYFLDCGRDRICPDNVPETGALADNGIDDDGDGAIDDGEYLGPDADGSEGDGVYQAMWIAGYGNSRPAMGVKDDMLASAVVFAQGDAAVGIVTLDVVGWFYDDQERISAKVQALRPGALDLVLVQATHTHEAPDTMGQWGQGDPFTGLPVGTGRDELHMEFIRDQAAAALVEALDNVVPVDVVVGKKTVGSDGLVRDSRDPQVFNDEVGIASLVAVDSGAPIGTLVMWGNHPELLDSRNNFISSDYPHAVRRAVEEGLPETPLHPARPPQGGVTVYLQGAVGGLMAPNGFPITGRDGTVYENDLKSFARVDAYGDLIAELAFQALDDATTLSAPRLAFSNVAYRAPVENVAFQVGMNLGWFDRATYDFDPGLPIDGSNVPHLASAVAVVRVGDLAFVTAPGEIFPETFRGFDGAVIDDENVNPPDLAAAPQGPYLKDLLDTAYAFPLGLTQDEMGYLVPPYDFKLGTIPYVGQAAGDHYEETNSIGPEAVPLMLEHLDFLFAFERARAGL